MNMNRHTDQTEASALLPGVDCEVGAADRSMELWEKEYCTNKRAQERWTKIVLATVVMTVLCITAYLTSNFSIRDLNGRTTSLAAYLLPFQFVRDEDGHFTLDKTSLTERYDQNSISVLLNIAIILMLISG